MVSGHTLKSSGDALPKHRTVRHFRLPRGVNVGFARQRWLLSHSVAWCWFGYERPRRKCILSGSLSSVLDMNAASSPKLIEVL